MRLLLDQNLSPRLVSALADVFPGSIHVRDVGLSRATDDAVWNYAAQHGHVIVSKDAEFHQRSFLLGHPPKVVWIRRGNCSTRDIETLLRHRHPDHGLRRGSRAVVPRALLVVRDRSRHKSSFSAVRPPEGGWAAIASRMRRSAGRAGIQMPPAMKQVVGSM